MNRNYWDMNRGSLPILVKDDLRMGARASTCLSSSTNCPQIELTKIGRLLDNILTNYLPFIGLFPIVGALLGVIVSLI